ncbi:Pentatricopeptide repeat-containing protein, chloroplastic [Vitis vinifera]|uniref:Pentatricopeptide repeat-containing protein, chloroplastic n=1 Tax=Vitis vinifera TaxID=29760 RepID=A0A438GJ88_VITVI|nr:Pentatricopeptide repeat-containing protein, chloroplastic [Vitis vinifera]
MPERNLGTWTLMTTRFAQLGCARDAIELFLHMELSGHALDRLVDMYAKRTADGSVDDLRKVFDRMPEHNVMSWTAIITAYVQIGECDKKLLNFSAR